MYNVHGVARKIENTLRPRYPDTETWKSWFHSTGKSGYPASQKLAGYRVRPETEFGRIPNLVEYRGLSVFKLNQTTVCPRISAVGVRLNLL